MIVDTSAIVAILRNEPEAAQIVATAAQARVLRMSAGAWIELGAVTSGDHAGVHAELEVLMQLLGIALVPVSVEQAQIGHQAYRTFGKGQHRARLNLGDCFAYALAKATGDTLLFKGDDFIHTDVRRAM